MKVIKKIKKWIHFKDGMVEKLEEDDEVENKVKKG